MEQNIGVVHLVRKALPSPPLSDLLLFVGDGELSEVGRGEGAPSERPCRAPSLHEGLVR